MFEERRIVMNKEISIQKEIVLEAYKRASEEQKIVLENLFGKDMFLPKDITERIKTFQDAVSELGENNPAVIDYYNVCDAAFSKDIIAFAKLRVITEALNEGWEPTFDNEEYRYYPWFYIYRKEEYEELNDDMKKELCVVRRSYGGSGPYGGVVCADAADGSSGAGSGNGSRLAFKTSELARYCGKQFIDIWADYLFS